MDPLQAGGPASERGFTLVELLVASMVSMMVLGGAVMLTSQVQNGYRRQVEEAAASQEGRYALEWVGKLIRGAGNNPFPTPGNQTTCPGPALIQIEAIRFDPDADGVNNDIRLQTDANPPDGQIGGNIATGCNQANEDVTIALDAVNDVIVFTDNNLGGGASIRTDAVIDDLRFIYRDGERDIDEPPGSGIPITAGNVVYVETQITIRTRTIDPSTGQPMRRVVSNEVRVRSR